MKNKLIFIGVFAAAAVFACSLGTVNLNNGSSVFAKEEKKTDKNKKDETGKGKNVKKESAESLIPEKSPLDGVHGDADVGDLILKLADYCGYNVILQSADKGAGKKVGFYNYAKLTKEETCAIFAEMVQLNEKTFYTASAFIKFTGRKEAVGNPIPFADKLSKIPLSAKVDFAILFFKPNYLTMYPDHFASLGRFFVSKDGGSSQFIAPNTTMIVDDRENIMRVLEIFELLDRPQSPYHFYSIEFKYMWVDDFAKIVEQVFDKPTTEPWQPGKGAGYGPKYQVAASIADQRTGKMFIVSNEFAYNKIMELKDILDVSSAKEGMVRVYHLQHQDAKKIAETLTGALQGTQADGGKGKKAAILQKEVKITADDKLNALMLYGQSKDVNKVIDIIKRLDVPRRQVFLETNIVELTDSSQGTTGVALWYTRNDDGTLSFVSSQYAGAQILNIDTSSLLGMAVGVKGEEVSGSEAFVSGLRLPSFASLLRLLQTTSKVDVVSSPFLLAHDGEEAKMVLGTNVPFQSGGSTDSLGYSTVNIQRQDVALTIKITPHISSADKVKLQIELDIQDILGISDTMGPTTSKRAVKTTVITSDGATIALGGLSKEITTKDMARIPFLSDIPVLGSFFSTKTVRKNKIHLLVFIKPYIIESEDDLRRLYKNKMKEHQEFAELYSSTPAHKIEKEADFDKKVGPLELIRQTIYGDASP